MSIVQVKNVTKHYGDVCALENISVTFGENKIIGLLGRNGAGKTTLLNLMTNRLFASGGEIVIDGMDVRENDAALSLIYYMSEQTLFPESMRVSEAFLWTQRYFPSFDAVYAGALCDLFGLSPKKRFKALSTGYTSIAKLIMALSVNTPVVIYDEPVLGLDANHRDLFYKELLANYVSHPKTVVLSTHIIEEIADLLEEVIIIKDHKVAVHQSVEELLSSAYQVSGGEEAVNRFLSGRRCIHRETMAGFCAATILGAPSDADQAELTALGLHKQGVELQKLFIHLTGEARETR